MSFPEFYWMGNVYCGKDQDGNALADVQVKQSQNGKPYCHFTVIGNKNRFNEQTQQWDTVKTIGMQVTVFGDYAATVAQNIHKGMRVLCVGELDEPGAYTGQDGQAHGSYRMIARTVAVIPSKPQQQSGFVANQQAAQPAAQQQYQSPQGGFTPGMNLAQQGQGQPQGQQPPADPWATNDGGFSQEPRF
ncbi:single-stranded DNA-binding protein [Bifidobacterium cuniculi]|uniref:Single-strand binding protein n=1 Tax=Bifidobacterium cuniculi TaxID=1688 RepID=A0A087B4Z2_9BIFI|nr:single-stranded DNA-binding protein [Bifidobacterium cuniculi]KFI66092.1 single-strand binding protein [Bifidobacterium cuniculi]